MKQWFLDVHPTLGLMGSAVVLVCILVAMSVYRGKNGERYSIWRHFVSELGELGVSKFAWVFNAGMINGGFLFFLMMPGVGLSLNSLWGYLATISGMIAAIGCLFVGVFPMNNIKPHIRAAMTYFRAGLATVILFSIAILVQDPDERIIPLYALFVSGIGIISYASFLFNLGKSLKQREANALDTSTIQERPRFWLMPLLEWMVVIFTILWFLIISIAR
jgi:hypothetical membrane protein